MALFTRLPRCCVTLPLFTLRVESDAACEMESPWARQNPEDDLQPKRTMNSFPPPPPECQAGPLPPEPHAQAPSLLSVSRVPGGLLVGDFQLAAFQLLRFVWAEARASEIRRVGELRRVPKESLGLAPDWMLGLDEGLLPSSLLHHPPPLLSCALGTLAYQLPHSFVSFFFIFIF